LPHATDVVFTSNYRNFVPDSYLPDKKRISLLQMSIDMADVNLLRLVLLKWSDLLMAEVQDVYAAVDHISSNAYVYIFMLCKWTISEVNRL
jgi:hypothetical protein